jgi:acetyl-CoA acetyltransferase
MRDVLIIDAVRSGVGRRNGSLSATHGSDLLGDVLAGFVGSALIVVLGSALYHLLAGWL